MDVQDEYGQRRAAAEAEFAVASSRARVWLALLLIALIAALTAAVRAWRDTALSAEVLSLRAAAMLAVLIVLLILRGREERRMARSLRIISFCERGLHRADGTAVQSGLTGAEYLDEQHLYARDLNVVGDASLFGMLATARTAVGARALAQMLLRGANVIEASERQAAVRELTARMELRESVALLGRSAYEEVPAEAFAHWVARNEQAPLLRFATAWRVGVALITLGWVALFALSLRSGASFAEAVANSAFLLALQGVASLVLRRGVVEELEAVQRLPGQTAMLEEGLRLLREQTFTSPRLQALQQACAHAGAEAKLRALERPLLLAEQRTKEWYYLVSMLFATGTQTALALQAWRRRDGGAMLQWVQAWADFEALLALSGYAAEHAENAWPEFVDGETLFAAKALRHPLLPRDAVANDVALGGERKFLLISGSNMAGKSTLLRALGTNALLAMAGAPVCAQSLRMTVMQVGASIGVGDSLAEGRSKFLAEAERLSDLLALARRGPLLFLIDEIFSGTNSADRRIAADAVLRGMVDAGAIGALSTHDLALTEVEGLGGVNVHMASPDADDPLRFDYLLKPGVNRTTNALAIVRMLGIAMSNEH